MPDGLYNRRADVWRPLIAIADVAGGSWPGQARQATRSLESSVTDDSESITVQLFADIRATFAQYGGDKIPSAKLAEYLNGMEDRPWPEFGRSRKPITVVQIARRLRGHAIAPGTIRMGDQTSKGYRLSQFNNAFTRYLPPFETTHGNNPQFSAENRPSQGVTSTPNVTVENPPKPAPVLDCGDVAVEKGGKAELKQFGFEDDPEERAAIQQFDGDGD